MIFWFTIWFHYWLPFLIACIYDMPNCFYLRYAKIVINLYKFMLSVLSQCHTRLIRVRAFSHSEQPQYALEVEQFRRDWTVALRVELLQLSALRLGQIRATLHSSLLNRIIASCAFEIPYRRKKQYSFEVPFSKLLITRNVFIHTDWRRTSRTGTRH